MKFALLGLTLVWMALGQVQVQTSPPGSVGPGRPDFGSGIPLTRQQRTALIKADHKKNVEDAAELLRLAEEVKTELDKEDAQVISVKTIKQTEDIEKLARSINGRLKRY